MRDFGDEFRAVDGFARGGRRDDVELGELIRFEDGLETPQGNEAFGAAGRRQLARGTKIAAKSRQHLLVEHRPDRASFDAIDDQTNGVRTDIDDRGIVIQDPALRHKARNRLCPGTGLKSKA